MGRKPGRQRSGIMALILLVVLAAALLQSSLIYTGPGTPSGVGPQPGLGAVLAEFLAEVSAHPGESVALVLDRLIEEVVQALGDPYSVYMEEAEFADFMDETTGTYGGIGVVIADAGDTAGVVSVMEGGPAERAGVQIGDTIVQIDGQNAVGIGFAAVAEILKGQVDTKVVLAVRRGGINLAPFTLIREVIRVNTVEGVILDGDIGYAAISLFNEHTAANLQRQLDYFLTLGVRGVRGVVLDLRGNPGGLLDQGVAVAGLLLPAGPVVRIINRNGREEILTTTGDGLGWPLVVLVDQGTASTSEIVAGAIQDQGEGVLVGTRTFGKGTVQSLYSLRNGRGLKVTVASYLTPRGRPIDGQGLSPDVVVEAAFGNGHSLDPVEDRQLQAGLTIMREIIGR